MTETSLNFNRRTLLASAGGIATLAATTAAIAETTTPDHQNMNHGTAETSPHQDVITAALDCVRQGNACMEHCINLFKVGDTTVAQCADNVSQMLPMCDTLAKLASYDSSHLKNLAKVCIAVCEECEKECRKHEMHHIPCKNCADSCLECIKACKALLS